MLVKITHNHFPSFRVGYHENDRKSTVIPINYRNSDTLNYSDRSGGTFNQIIAHHSHILMFQVVAVVKKKSGVVAKPDQNPNPFAGHQQHRILPAFIHIPVMR